MEHYDFKTLWNIITQGDPGLRLLTVALTGKVTLAGEKTGFLIRSYKILENSEKFTFFLIGTLSLLIHQFTALLIHVRDNSITLYYMEIFLTLFHMALISMFF